MLVWVYPRTLRLTLDDWPGWIVSIVDLVVLSAPLVAAVLLAARLASTGLGRAAGVRRWVWTDLALGLAVALLIRAVAQVVPFSWPAAGSLVASDAVGVMDAAASGDPAASTSTVAATVVIMIGVIAITPIVEEFFFRGLVQRAFAQTLGGLGRAAASILAIIVATAFFTGLHIVNAPPTPALLVGTIGVGLGAGILTAVTGRLGGALVVHVTNNALVVVLPLL